jgi:Fe-S-cluster containining protein
VHIDRSGMRILPELAGDIRSTGFRCKQCGTCCSCIGTESNLVMVSNGEIRSIMSATGLPWNSVAGPYPEMISHQNSARYTLGWCLFREGDHCSFLKDNLCTIYEQRPWICRTYPFFLDENNLGVSRCEGLGLMISEEDASIIACHLLQRREAEEKEEHQVRQVLQHAQIPSGACVVIDSEGVRVVDG